LSFQFLYDIMKNTLFISLLYILRHNKDTYYYYKGIKMVYYKNVGYLYNVIPLENAIYLTNVIIKEKRWYELNKIEVVNAFFMLILNKLNFTNPSDNIYVLFQMYMDGGGALYTLVTLLKICYISNIVLFNVISIICVLKFCKFNLKNLIGYIIIYFLIVFNINYLIISTVIISNKIIYYWIEEIWFFSKNINNIRKVIKLYNHNSINEYQILEKI
jgi:hypothetical protein